MKHKSFQTYLTEVYNELQAAYTKAAFAVMNYYDLGEWRDEEELMQELFKNDRLDPFLPRIAIKTIFD